MDDKLSIVALNESEEVPHLESEDDDEEEDYKQLDGMTTPLAVNWIKRGLLKGVLLIDDDALMLYESRINKSDNVSKAAAASNIVDDDGKNPNKRKRDNVSGNNPNERTRDNDNHHTCCELFDVCPICFQPWSSDGLHQICSLSCGHMFGRSCINKWLQQEDQSSSGKCPQCNITCTLKDVRPLYATRLSVAKYKPSMQKVLSSSTTTTTRRFRYTKKGYKAFKKYVLQRKSVALRLERVFLNRKVDVLRRAKDATDRLHSVSEQRGKLLESRTGAEGPQADAFQQRADALERQVLRLGLQADALELRGYALGQWVCEFSCLNDVYAECINYFEETCKWHDMDWVLVED